MSKKIIVLVILFVGLLIIGGLVYTYLKDKKKTEDTPPAPPAPIDPKAQNQAAIGNAVGAGLSALITIIGNSQKPKNVAQGQES